MKIIEIKERTPLLIEQLLEVWEKSVKKTHLFLSDIEREDIKKYVPQALNSIVHLIIVENESKCPVAFLGWKIKNLKCCLSHLKKEGKDLGKS